MVDAGRVDDARRIAEALAVQRRRSHVQRLVVERLCERALLEVAADDRHLVDRRDRRHAQVAQGRDQPAPRCIRQRQVVDRCGEHVGDLLRDQLLRRGHADVDRLVEAADRCRRLLAERGVCLVADHELVRITGDLVAVAREPRVGLDRDRVRRPRRGVPREDRVVEALAVAVLGQLPPELVDEQAAVREDQDAFAACGLDEAGGGDRLAGSGRVAEAVAAHGAGVLRSGERGRLVVFVLAFDGRRGLELVLGLFVLLRLLGMAVPVPVAVLAALLRGGDQLGEHPGERVDLVAAQLGAGGEPRRLLGQHALEAEEQGIPHLPLG